MCSTASRYAARPTDLRRVPQFVRASGPHPFIDIEYTKNRMQMMSGRQRESICGVQLLNQMHMRLRQSVERFRRGQFAQRRHTFRCNDLDRAVGHPRELRHVEFRQVCDLARRIAHALHLSRLHRDQPRHPFLDAHQVLENLGHRPRLFRRTRLAQRLRHRVDSRYQLRPRTICIVNYCRQPGMHGRSSRHCRAVR